MDFQHPLKIKTASMNRQFSVKTYSGYKADERPLSFILDDVEHYIEEIIDAWVGKEFDYWKVKDADGERFLIKRDKEADEWALEEVAG